MPNLISATLTHTECCLEFTTQLWLSNVSWSGRGGLRQLEDRVRPKSLGPTLHPQHALAFWSCCHPVSRGSDNSSTYDIRATCPTPPPAQISCPSPVQEPVECHLSRRSALRDRPRDNLIQGGGGIGEGKFSAPPIFGTLCTVAGTTVLGIHSGRAVLNGEKKVFLYTVSPKQSPRAHQVLAAGGGRLAVGHWPLVAVGGGWWLAVDGPLGRSLRAVVNKKKSSPLRTPMHSGYTKQLLGYTLLGYTGTTNSCGIHRIPKNTFWGIHTGIQIC